jgi:hypothetical protein
MGGQPDAGSQLLKYPEGKSAQWVAEVARLAGAPHMALSKARCPG